MSGLVKDITGNDLTYRIIGAAMEVHNCLGSGYKEEVYEQALAAELERRDISARRQVPVEVLHQSVPVALFYLDLFVEELVVVEVKAFSHPLTNDEFAQVINYLKATRAPVGLLFNFGRRRLEYRRLFPAAAAPDALPQRLGRDNVVKPVPSQSSGRKADPIRADAGEAEADHSFIRAPFVDGSRGSQEANSEAVDRRTLAPRDASEGDASSRQR